MGTNKREQRKRNRDPHKHPRPPRRNLGHEHEYFYRRAKREGYRARSVYKLKQLDEKYHLFSDVRCVVDFCCAPGSWLQYCVKILAKLGKHRAESDHLILGVDRVPVDPVPGTEILRADIMRDSIFRHLHEALPRPPDLVLSDCSPHTVGKCHQDHKRQAVLVARVVTIAERVLAPSGHFVGKIFRGWRFKELDQRLQQHFREVRVYKPRACRKNSLETYLVGLGKKK